MLPQLAFDVVGVVDDGNVVMRAFQNDRRQGKFLDNNKIRPNLIDELIEGLDHAPFEEKGAQPYGHGEGAFFGALRGTGVVLDRLNP